VSSWRGHGPSPGKVLTFRKQCLNTFERIYKNRSKVYIMAIQYHKLESIISVARSLFARYGLRKTSLEEVARLARVAKGTIYNYFGSKDRVYMEVLRREVREVIEGIRREVAKGPSPAEKLKRFITARLSHIDSAHNLRNLERGRDHFPQGKVVKQDFFQQEVALIEEILCEGKKRGIFCIGDPRALAQSIIMALRGFERGKDDMVCVEESLRVFVSLLFEGLLCREGARKSKEVKKG